jgi:hypothetical protein
MAEEFTLSVNVDADLSKFRQTLRAELEAVKQQGATVPVGATVGAAGTNVVPPGGAGATVHPGASPTAQAVAQQAAQSTGGISQLWANYAAARQAGASPAAAAGGGSGGERSILRDRRDGRPARRDASQRGRRLARRLAGVGATCGRGRTAAGVATTDAGNAAADAARALAASRWPRPGRRAQRLLESRRPILHPAPTSATRRPLTR